VVANFHVASADDPSDDPTRDRPLRDPHPSPDWLADLLMPRAPSDIAWRPLPLGRMWAVECYAGRGSVGRALEVLGLRVIIFEAPPRKGVYVRAKDLDCNDIFMGLVVGVRSGFIRAIFFGTPCSSWGTSNQLNHGTRSTEHPDGGPEPLPRELRGKQQASTVAKLPLFFTSTAAFLPWKIRLIASCFIVPLFQELSAQCPTWKSAFDQCADGLKLPGSASHVFCKKRTAILANFSSISVLN